MTRPDGADLTAEQRAAVELSGDARAFVFGGPGAGKTFVLAQRAESLLAQGMASSEVLVLSFTNAVVGELRRRLADQTAGESAYLRPVTIDSFAGRIRAAVGEDHSDGAFDATVASATRLVSEGGASSVLSRLRHVIVDEAQDLVGVRLDLITAVLRATDGGFTVLGDPAQGIYGFSGDADNQDIGIDALKAAFPDAAAITIKGDHRSLRTDAAPGHALRQLLLAGGNAEANRAFRRRLHDCDRYTVAQVSTVLRRADATTALLCRTNGEALFVAGLLADAGVKHTVRRAAGVNVPPAWIANVLSEFEGDELSRRLFVELVGESGEWTDRAWQALRGAAGSRTGGVDLQRLRERLPSLKSEEAPGSTGSKPVISTVHRAKGLEYDTVFVLESENGDAAANQGEEARILYVAMTRARLRTARVVRPEFPGQLVRLRGRWVMLPWRGRGLKRVELRAGDMALTLDERLDNDEVRAQQEHLRRNVAPGNPVALVLAESGREYIVRHDGIAIGRTSQALTGIAAPLPSRIDGVRIDCLRSVATDPGRTANLGLGAGGFFLAPELVGLGRVAWENPSG